MNTYTRICQEGDIGCPHKIVFSLEDNSYYYLQLWNRSDANINPEILIEEQLCRIPTDYLRTFLVILFMVVALKL